MDRPHPIYESSEENKRAKKGQIIPLFFSWAIRLLLPSEISGLLFLASAAPHPLGHRPSAFYWVIPMAFLILQIADGRPCNFSASITWADSYNKFHVYRWLSSKESVCQCWRHGFDPWVKKVPWRRKWHPTPVFLPGKSHGQSRLVGYSPWGCKVSDTTEQLSNWACMHVIYIKERDLYRDINLYISYWFSFPGEPWYSILVFNVCLYKGGKTESEEGRRKYQAFNSPGSHFHRRGQGKNNLIRSNRQWERESLVFGAGSFFAHPGSISCVQAAHHGDGGTDNCYAQSWKWPKWTTIYCPSLPLEVAVLQQTPEFQNTYVRFCWYNCLGHI